MAKLKKGTTRKSPVKRKSVAKYADYSGSEGSEAPPSSGEEETISEQEKPEASTKKKGKPGRPRKSESTVKSPSKSTLKESKKNNVKAFVDSESDEEPAKPKEISKTPSSPKRKKGKRKVSPAKHPKSPKKKVKAESESEEEEEDGKEYEVDRILDVHFHKDGKREFHVKWKGYSMSKATWEPEENLECPALVAAFMAKVDDDYVPRSGRLRDSTVRRTRASVGRQLERVRTGRVSKSRSRSRHIKLGNSVVREVKMINGQLHRYSVMETVHSNSQKRNRMRVLGRHSLIRAGIAVSLGLSLAGIYFTHPSYVMYDHLSSQLAESFDHFRNLFHF